MVIAVFFVAHWFLSLFFQTVFHHRYASHGMFTMSRFWERTFYLLSFVVQGSSFLNPRAYAIMHRAHHAHSDTELDPHSPHRFPHVFAMMADTFKTYRRLVDESLRRDVGPADTPRWPALDRLADSWFVRIGFMGLYTAFYVAFAPSPWWYLLLPVHFVMGPVHGAIVNWCGHKYGYVNYRETNDRSRNTLPIDFLTLGELFQNNHHKFPRQPNFARRSFEFDPTWPVLRLMHAVGVLRLRPSAASGPVAASQRRSSAV